VQVPATSSVTVLPDTAQTEAVVDAKLTGRPDEAVALTVNGAVPYVAVGMDGKVIAWGRRVTEKLCVAATEPYCELPACVALMVQVPTSSKLAVFPETVQIEGVEEAKLTGSPDETVALRLTDPVTSVEVGIATKLMV